MGAVDTVITVDASFVTPLYVALTKTPTVPAKLAASNVTEVPVELVSEPRELLVRVQAYEIPDGHVALHVGVAVKGCVPPVDTVGLVGLIDTEVNVIGVVVTVITVDATSVTPLSVALTKMPTVPAVLAASKVTEDPVVPVREPIEVLVRAQA
jgi:hypothetical protein